MFELAFVGLIVLVFYHRRSRARGWNRADLDRTLAEVRRSVRRSVRAVCRPRHGCVAQCAEDLKDLGADLVRVMSPKARSRLERNVRRWSQRDDGSGSGVRQRRAAGSRPRTGPRRNGAFARLQRRYIDGRISLEDYVEAVRKLQIAGTRAVVRRTSRRSGA